LGDRRDILTLALKFRDLFMNLYKIVLIFISSFMLLQCQGGRKEAGSQISDSERFALEYPLVGKDNIFVYRNAGETADILAKGRGIVFIGFKECPWCQLYAVFFTMSRSRWERT
jgi:hypothetical protein